MSGPPDAFRPDHPPGRTVGGLARRIGTNPRGDHDASTVVTGVTHDSRRVRPGDLYVALSGDTVHGARFAESASQSGAVAVLTDPSGAALIDTPRGDVSVPVLVVEDPRALLGELASWVYGDPSHRLKVIGITGTNGKTTTAYLMEAALRAAGHTTGLIGTVEIRVAGRSIPSARTTPEAPDLQALFAVMLERGVSVAVIEVSSHSLVLHRVDGTRFAATAFTNFSQDHLDFHGSLEDYFAAKAMLLDRRAEHEVVVVDDQWGRRLVGPHTVTVSTPMRGPEDSPAPADSAAVWRAEEVEDRPEGVSFRLLGPGLPDQRVSLQLPGSFNAANAALAVAVVTALGVDPHLAVAGVESLTAIPGRVERVDAGQGYLAVVDYAHTPDAVATLLAALRSVTASRLITVLGCGGDRDPDKRPLMGEAAARGSDIVFVTDDNPRSEPPELIRAAVRAGAEDVPQAQRAEVHEVGDRRVAIADATRRARPGDTVVIAGKGHEQGQEVASVVHPFDDRVVLREAITASTGGHVPPTERSSR